MKETVCYCDVCRRKITLNDLATHVNDAKTYKVTVQEKKLFLYSPDDRFEEIDICNDCRWSFYTLWKDRQECEQGKR